MAVQIQSLELWRRALVASVRADTPDLSARQMALLLNVYLDDGPHTVRGLAKILNISKPAISRALDRLEELFYVRRERDEIDRRNVLIERTSKGSEFLTLFSRMIDDSRNHAATLPSRVIEFAIKQPAAVQVMGHFDMPLRMSAAAYGGMKV